MASSEEAKTTSTSPFVPMFEHFRAELDEHHERRERVIKASRDITAASKKIIFSLQRARALGSSVPSFIAKANDTHYKSIRSQYVAVTPDLQGLNADRYARNITGGSQELVEALSFQHYLENQTLISFEDMQAEVADMCKIKPKPGEGTDEAMEEAVEGDDSFVTLSAADYILGVFDMTGELMRFAVTVMATTGEVPSGRAGRTVLQDMRDLRTVLERFEFGSGSPLAWDVGKKMPVMQASVEKVENALYGLIVRGAERPKGWMPDVGERRGGEEIEGY